MTQQNHRHQFFVVSGILLLITVEVHAELTVFTNRAAWETAVGEFTTIGFADLPIGTWVTEQYADLGAHFTDGGDQVIGTSFVTYPQDGMGLSGFGGIAVEFDAPMFWLGTDYPGTVMIEIFSGGQLIGETLPFGGGTGNFLGILSTEPFDAVNLSDLDGFVFIDDLHFGPPIPAPGAVVVIALASVMSGRRRRR